MKTGDKRDLSYLAGERMAGLKLLSLAMSMLGEKDIPKGARCALLAELLVEIAGEFGAVEAVGKECEKRGGK